MVRSQRSRKTSLKLITLGATACRRWDVSSNANTIFVVDDSPIARAMMRIELEESGYRVEEAEDGEEARALMATLPEIDAVLLDWHLPGANGIDLLREWMVHPRLRWIPVLMITADDDPTRIREALAAGAIDFLRKPPEPLELHARLTAALRIKELHDELRSLALHDPLTGLLNRRALDFRLDDEISRAVRYSRELSCVLVDADHFKRVNDSHGHAIGDRVLQHIAQHLSKGLRKADTVARWGGEEFLLLLPETPLESAVHAVDRLRMSLAEQPCVWGDVTVAVTWSAGVSSLGRLDTQDASTLVAAADKALYAAKAAGRNCVRAAGTET